MVVIWKWGNGAYAIQLFSLAVLSVHHDWTSGHRVFVVLLRMKKSDIYLLSNFEIEYFFSNIPTPSNQPQDNPPLQKRKDPFQGRRTTMRTDPEIAGKNKTLTIYTINKTFYFLCFAERRRQNHKLRGSASHFCALSLYILNQSHYFIRIIILLLPANEENLYSNYLTAYTHHKRIKYTQSKITFNG